MRIVSTHITQTAHLSPRETATGYEYAITHDHVAQLARISWWVDGEVRMVESSAAGGILRACDVPDEDAGLIAEAVATLAASPLAAALALDLQSRLG